MIDMIVAGLSGSARDFYDLEFDFFDTVTSISGKLRPYIKRSKPEKKVGRVGLDGGVDVRAIWMMADCGCIGQD